MTAKVVPEFNKQEFRNYTVAGYLAGAYKLADQLSFVRIFGAGHMVRSPPGYSFFPTYMYSDVSCLARPLSTTTLNLAAGQVAVKMFGQAMFGITFGGDWDHLPAPPNN